MKLPIGVVKWKSIRWRTYRSMLNRCYNKKAPQYKYCGARGITVCKEWKESFIQFYNDVGPRPKNKVSLDRIDNDKGYSPENCRWADSIEQNNNKQYNRVFLYEDKQRSITEIANIMDVSRTTVYKMFKNKSLINE